MELKAIGNRVILQAAMTPGKSNGGIIIPDNYRVELQHGVIRSIGDAVEAKLKVNDVVIFEKYAGTRAGNDGEFIILNLEDLIGRIEE